MFSKGLSYFLYKCNRTMALTLALNENRLYVYATVWRQNFILLCYIRNGVMIEIAHSHKSVRHKYILCNFNAVVEK